MSDAVTDVGVVTLARRSSKRTARSKIEMSCQCYCTYVRVNVKMWATQISYVWQIRIFLPFMAFSLFV